MRAVNYRQDAERRTGYLFGEQVYEVFAVMHALGLKNPFNDCTKPKSIDDWLAAGADAWGILLDGCQALGEAGPESLGLAPAGAHRDLTIEPALCRPGKIICAALNYPHPDGSTVKPDYPVLFMKPGSSLTGHRQPVLLPPGGHTVEYEGEIAVVIGRRGKYIPQNQALAHIAGYCLANDIGAQDIQQRNSQWASGKMQDTFTPLGPWLVTADEMEDANNLRLQTILNGEIVQDAISAEMFYSISELIAYISSLTTLEAGDLILTGSPRRAGGRPDPRTALKPGDQIDIFATGLSTLSNPVVQEETMK